MPETPRPKPSPGRPDAGPNATSGEDTDVREDADDFDGAATVVDVGGPGSLRPSRKKTPSPGGAGRETGGWAGVHIDHFEIEKPIGEGGMGAVYKARDLSLDRAVAIKVLARDLGTTRELEQRFLREARAQARLQSQHVAHIYFIGETPPDEKGRTARYFAMELVDGGSLEDVVEDGTALDPERARQLMLEVAEGLRDAHEAGIVHRDIKPGNLLLDRNGHIRIVDFGLAKPVDDAGPGGVRLTQAGMVLGSPFYMSPEQATSEPDIDFRSDMYSLGCTFYHLIAGEPPFDAATGFAIANKHVNEEPVPLHERVERVPRAISAIISRLMSKKRDDRFGSYAELIEALEDAEPEKKVYASFSARGTAFVIDLVLAGIVVGLIGWPGLLLHLAYVSVAHSKWGQTLGKRLMHIRVRPSDDPEGTISLGRSAARTIASLWLPLLVGLIILLTEGTDELTRAVERLDATELAAVESVIVAYAVSNGLLSLIYAAGMVMAAFHPDRRAVHDIIVGSEVVYELRSE